MILTLQRAAQHIEEKYPKAIKKEKKLSKQFNETDAALRAAYGDHVVNEWVKRGTDCRVNSKGEVDSPFKSTIPRS